MTEMHLTFHGAVDGQVTGSMHLLECAGGKFLLDAGMFQGRRAEADQRNRSLTVDPRTLSAVVLSHAHIDPCAPADAGARGLSRPDLRHPRHP